MKLKIRKGATVEVITGSDKGKRGTVLGVNAVKMRVRVQGVKIQTHHSKKDGLVKSEGTIHYSNVKLIESATPAKKSAEKKTEKTEKKTAKAKSA